MTPNFTLSLSFEGIRLFEEQSGDWVLLGEVALDADDLNAELAKLRTLATDRAGPDFRTKLLLPNEQIRYTAIDSTMTTDEDITAAIDGATPYPLDELVIDHDRSGGRTHIAVVAKETLAEAEAFAVEHGFNPVAFVAAAEPFTFRSEVLFGQTKAAADLLPDGVEIERGTPLRYNGVEPTELASTAETVEPEADDSTEAAEPEPEQPSASDEDTHPAEKAADAEPAKEDEPEVLFTRRNREPVLAATRDVTENNEGISTKAPSPVAAPTAVADAPQARPEFVLEDPSVALDARPAQVIEDADAILGRKSKTRRGAVAAAPAVRGKPKYLGLIMTVCLLIALLLAALWANTLSEDGVAGWFDRTFSPVELEEPNITPEIVVAPDPMIEPQPDTDVAATVPSPSLPIVRQPTGRVLSPAEADRIYAATGVYQRAPRLPVTPRETSLDTLQRARAMPPAERMASLAFDGTGQFAYDDPISSPADPPPPGTRYLRDLRGFILAKPEGVVTPEGALLIAGVPERLPPARPGTEPLPVNAIAPAAIIDPDAFRLIGGRPPLEPPLRPEGLAPVVEAAVTDVEPSELAIPDVETTVVTEAEPVVIEEAPQTSATIVALQPSEPDVATEEPEAVEITAPTIEAEAPRLASVTPQDQLPNLTDLSQTVEAALTEVPAETESAATETLDVATAFPVTDGRPDIVPPLRPARFADLVQPEETPNVAVANVETEAVTQAVEEALASFVADPALAGKRPSARPNDGLSQAVVAALTANVRSPQARPARPAPVEPEVVQPDVSAVAAAIAAAAPQVNFNAVTASAVPASLRPDSRPRNFSQVVARARAAAAPPASTTSGTAVSSAPAVASGPVPGGVARAATVDNAIRLRNLNLIGVYGRSNDRRALVRLSNGRYVKVEVGSRLDGGRVTAINDDALNYVKNGRTLSLELPSG